MRLVSWPSELKITAIEPLNGPLAIGSSSSRGADGYVQTVASPSFAWEFDIQFPSLIGKRERAFRAWVMSLHSGANATRFPFIGGSKPKLSDYDLPDTNVQVSQANYFPTTIRSGYGSVPVSETAGFGTTIIKLDSDLWGHKLDTGTYIGFCPLHLGVYMVTEVISDGEYRIYPPLRKEVSQGDLCTLDPVLALRPLGVGSISMPRGAIRMDGASMQMVEVLDYDLREQTL